MNYNYVWQTSNLHSHGLVRKFLSVHLLVGFCGLYLWQNFWSDLQKGYRNKVKGLSVGFFRNKNKKSAFHLWFMLNEFQIFFNICMKET